MRPLTKSVLIATIFAGGGLQAFAQFAATGTTTLSVTVAAESAIQINTATTNLAEASGVGVFGAPYTGTTSFAYKVRSGKAGGAGAITVKITADFAAGGPSVATPLPGDTVTYACTTAASALACVGPVNASASAATSVASFGVDAHSAQGAGASDAGTVTWTLPNDPKYQTGVYTATATFTISAT